MLARKYVEQRIIQKALNISDTRSVRLPFDSETVLQRWLVQNADSDMVRDMSIATRNSLLDLIKFALAQPADAGYRSSTNIQETIQ